jgi:hypothetical protein
MAPTKADEAGPYLLETIARMERRLGQADDALDQSGRKALHLKISGCYNQLAYGAELCKDQARTLEYYRKSIENNMHYPTVVSYLRELHQAKDDKTRFQQTMTTLASLGSLPSECGNTNQLVAFLSGNLSWPAAWYEDWDKFMAQSAQETGSLQWLIEAYHAALKYSLLHLKSHIHVLLLEACLLYLYRDYAHDYDTAEPLFEELGIVASCRYQFPTPTSHCVAWIWYDWSHFRIERSPFMDDYCRVQLRKIVVATAVGQDPMPYIENVEMLYRAGFEAVNIER